jgi:glycosyltransferase involved in cell wall biosynthesis
MFVVTEDWYFVSHRMPIARAARDAGYEVLVATRVDASAAPITKEGFTLVPLEVLRRRNRNPFRELWAIGELAAIYRRYRPDVVHHVALKPVLYGSLAARIARVPATVNALAGLGFVFSSPRVTARLLRPIVQLLLRRVLNLGRTLLIVQNRDDQHALTDRRIVDSTGLRLIRGSGVDMTRFHVTPMPAGAPVVLLASRMLWDKGVGDFVAAAKRLRDDGTSARFVLTGAPDTENPAAVPMSTLETWHREGLVEWWGYRTDMPDVIAQATIVCLPSTYGEGVPKILIEAAASGRPVVAYDIPGCREIVRPPDNGLLVPPKDLGALADALAQLIANPRLCVEMGAHGRQIASEFSEEVVVAETLRLYDELLSRS